MILGKICALLQQLPENVRSDPVALFSRILRFYDVHRIEGTTIEEDGDMLLFQWGVYDWGKGPSFELDLTRQAIALIPADDEYEWEEQDIRQLCCTFYYLPEPFRSIEEGNRWCHSPAGLAAFQQFVLEHPVLYTATKYQPHNTTIEIIDAE